MVDGRGVAFLTELTLEFLVEAEDGALGAWVDVACPATTGDEALPRVCVLGCCEVDTGSRAGGVGAWGGAGWCAGDVSGAAAAGGEVVRRRDGRVWFDDGVSGR